MFAPLCLTTFCSASCVTRNKQSAASAETQGLPAGSVIGVGPGVHVWEPEQLEEAKPRFVPKVKSEAVAETDGMVEEETGEG